MQLTKHYPPHPPEWRRTLRAAGMSEESELTYDEGRYMPTAVALLERKPNAAKNVLYRIIRPYQEFPDDD